MVDCHIIQRPAFWVAGQRTWISGPDNAAFGRFWAQAHKPDGLLSRIKQLQSAAPAPCTASACLGVSCVDADPAVRSFWFWIAAEVPHTAAANADALALLTRQIPACTWAVFDAGHQLPDSLVAAEMYAFGEWLPGSGYQHALAPELEVYLPDDAGTCQFWLPVIPA